MPIDLAEKLQGIKQLRLNYQPKGFKGDEDKGPEELPNFIEKKVKKRVKSA